MHAAWPLPDQSPLPLRFDAALRTWLDRRTGTVAAKTLRADQDLLRLVPQAFLARPLATIGPKDVTGILSRMRARGLSEPSVRRHRSSLSQFFAWSVRSGLITASPVEPLGGLLPPAPATVNPFTADELEAAWRQWCGHSTVLADVMLILARTGLRWSEARALTTADATPDSIVVGRRCSEGGTLRRLPQAQRRAVPVAPRIRPIIGRLIAGRDPAELLLTTGFGSQLHRTAVLRRLNWAETGRGRRLHDLRHTAAHLWLAEGVSTRDVRAWMGPTRLAE
ncbi:tyrosine-type recombinase/integrase [Micropruina sp.]|uniref:tyrosine-type recombinase/integrase n=1 Tax=Micropruina sp. TaxID=2737536 RepID=UPI0039E3EF7D